MKIKVLAIDLDGTLLKNDKSIDLETINFIQQFQRNNGILVLITGRRKSELLEYIKVLKMDELKTGYAVTCDGQYIWDIRNNTMIISNFLNKNDVNNISKNASTKGYNVSFYNSKYDFFISQKSISLKIFIYGLRNKIFKNNNRVKYILLSKLDSYDEIENIEKIVLSGKGKPNFSDVQNTFKNYDIKILEDGKVELSQKNVNKCKALVEIMKMNDLKNEDVLVFGDGGNDIKMLSYFKNSYAMGNACEIVKQSAHHITDTNEAQGVLKVLKKHMTLGVQYEEKY